MRMPLWAALPVPTMMATGVASPSAQGQEITSTRDGHGQGEGEMLCHGKKPDNPALPRQLLLG